MGFIDSFTSDGTVELKYKEFYSLMRESAKSEFLMNGIKARVPEKYLEALITGKASESRIEESEDTK